MSMQKKIDVIMFHATLHCLHLVRLVFVFFYCLLFRHTAKISGDREKEIVPRLHNNLTSLFFISFFHF